MRPFQVGELGRMATAVTSTTGPDSGIGLSITIRRGASTLAAQDVRLAQSIAQARTAQGVASEEQRATMLVIGAPDLNIQVGDRFNDGNGVLYRIVFVRPNRQIETVAEAEAIE